MATWQADFEVVLPPAGLPTDYKALLGEILPPGASWHTDLQVWGSEDGDRIDVWTDASEPPELLARFDLRTWRPAIYERFLSFVRNASAAIRDTDTGATVPATVEDFTRALRESRAAQFVRDPLGYLRRLT